MVVTFEVSEHMTFNQKQQTMPVTLLPNATKKLHIATKAVKQGSAYIKIFVTYRGLDTKIMFKKYTFIERE